MPIAMATQLVVRIAPPGAGGIETRTFTRSPVSVGSAESNLLRLDHPSVAAHQGAFSFSSSRVIYEERAGGTGARVGELQPQLGERVSVNEETLVQIGRFRLCAEVVAERDVAICHDPRSGSAAPSAFEWKMPAIVGALASHSGGALPTLESLTSFVYRALRLADVVSAVIVRLRAGCGIAAQRPFDCSPLRSSWNAYEIAEYLLDTDAPENRLVVLERYLVELAERAQVPRSAPVGQA